MKLSLLSFALVVATADAAKPSAAAAAEGNRLTSYKSSTSQWTFKCGNNLYLCGFSLTDDGSNGQCKENGVDYVMYATAAECNDLIEAARSEDPYSYACPLLGGKTPAISHFTEYSCADGTGVKYGDGSLYAGEGRRRLQVETCSSNFEPIGGKCGGDPHFRTFDGTQYSYHGECDLVMARSPSFADNLGLDVHIRTKSMGSWSLISNAALRIGEDIFEFENDGSHYINGSPMALPYDMAGRYTVTKERTITEKEDEEGNIRTLDKTVATVELGSNKYIRFTRLGKGIMFVKVNVFLEDSEGMLGIHGVEGMVGRDRQTTLSDPNEMGAQWQVNDSEAMLFREIRAPQFPQSCILPDADATQRRLRMSEAEMDVAVKACAAVADESRALCIDDVLLSGDVHSADGYLFGEAF